MFRVVTDEDQLKSISEDTTFEEAKEIIFNLQKHLAYVKGIGMAAPQIGVKKKVAYIDYPKKITLINPKIVKYSKDQISSEESCLSVPNLVVKIARSKKIKMDYINYKGEQVVEEFEGDLAVVIQHEVDHLYGVLISDYKRGENI